MAVRNLIVIHKQRANTAINWTMSNPVLALGEIGVVTDTTPIRIKIGDGVKTWQNLPYVGEVHGLSVGVANSLANLPIDKSSMIVSINTAQPTFSYAATPAEGFQQSILLKNTAGGELTQALPSTGGWIAVDGNSVKIPSNGAVELSVWYIDSTYRLMFKK